jgi:hypothetical protein
MYLSFKIKFATLFRLTITNSLCEKQKINIKFLTCFPTAKIFKKITIALDQFCEEPNAVIRVLIVHL